MALGAYSVVRFSNNLNDQRVNLGVVAWHPLDGLKYRFTDSFNRVHAVDPNTDIDRVRTMVQSIREQINACTMPTSKVLLELSRSFRNGVEFTAPSPARMYSLHQTLDHLFEMLITPRSEERKPNLQHRFENELQNALRDAAKKLAKKYQVEEMGKRRINGVIVDLGVQVRSGKRSSLWHPLALQFKSSPSSQVAKAKATAMELLTIRHELPEFKKSDQIVALQHSDGGEEDAYLTASVAWLKHGQAEVLVVADTKSLSSVIRPRLVALTKSK